MNKIKLTQSNRLYPKWPLLAHPWGAPCNNAKWQLLNLIDPLWLIFGCGKRCTVVIICSQMVKIKQEPMLLPKTKCRYIWQALFSITYHLMPGRGEDQKNMGCEWFEPDPLDINQASIEVWFLTQG